MSDRKAFIQAADRTCSALMLNCCQLSCCLPQNAFVHVTAPPQAADWMGELSKADPSIRVRDLVVPGTHDSASYTIAGWKPFSAVGRTQSLTVTQQLVSGARYLDIRFAGAASDPSKLSIWHGCLEGGPLEDILEEIDDFLQQHKGEFVVLELVPEYGRSLTPEQKDIFLQLVKSTFGDKIFPGKNLRGLQERLTLGEVVNDQKRQVAILLHNRFQENYDNKSEDDIVNEYGYVKSQRYMRNKWHNTREREQLLEWNLEECEKCSPHVWLNNQFVLTPGVGGASDILGALVGSITLQPMAMASRLYEPKVLDSFLRQHAEKRWNLMMLDCIDRCPIVVQFAIALNFPTEVVIKRAAAACGDSSGGVVDVTEKLKSYVCRNRVLLLTDVSSDLELPSNEGVLTVAYQMDKTDEVVTIDFSADTQFILSKFVTTEFTGTRVAVSSSDKQQPEGFVARGQVYSEPPSSRPANCPVLKFKCENDAVEFDIAE